MGPAGGGDAGDPESPEVRLPVAAVAIGVLLRPVHRFGRRAEQPALGPVVPFGQLESLLMTCAGLGPAFSPWHGGEFSFLGRCSSVHGWGRSAAVRETSPRAPRVATLGRRLRLGLLLVRSCPFVWGFGLSF